MMKSKLVKGVVVAALLSVTASAAVANDGMRQVEAEHLLVIDTNKGRILVEMNPDIAPLHVERIRLLAGEGFYDNVKWHRVIDGFMAQTGDPTGTGEGESQYEDLKAELTFRRMEGSTFTTVAQPMGLQIGLMDTVPVFSQPDHYMARSSDGRVSAWGTYCPGVAGMARDDDENSANSQFFLMRSAYPSLDKRYSIWGRVIAGQDVVDSLKAGALPSGMVDGPDVMLRVRTGDQLNQNERPSVRVSDTRSAQFAEQVATIRAERGADFSVCDLPIRVEVTATQR